VAATCGELLKVGGELRWVTGAFFFESDFFATRQRLGEKSFLHFLDDPTKDFL
jgi:hypothetical protein